MAVIPRAALRQRITIEPYLGTGAYGPSYGPEVTGVPARFDGKRRVVRRADGTDLVASGTLLLRPDVTIPEQSRVTIPGAGQFEVVEALPEQGLTRPHHIEVLVS